MATHDSQPILVSDHLRSKPALTSGQLTRQLRSCKACRFRKVKCDRVKPCHACCAHGHPSKCHYDTSPEDFLQPISQADEIRNLREEIRELTASLHNCEQRIKSSRRRAQLQGLVNAIRSAPPNAVNRLVAQIRKHRGETNEVAIPVGPLNGMEAEHGPVVLRRSHSYDSDDDSLDSEDEVFSLSGSRSSSEESEDSSYGSISHIGSWKPMLDVFIERFVDAFSPVVQSKTGQAGALRRAAEIRMFSPILVDAFESVSIAYFGRSIQDKNLEAAGFRLYPRVLRSLQQALQDPQRSKAESTLVTVTLLMAFESVERTTQVSLIAHVHGALRLIEHRGPENHIHGVEHLLYTELRPYWVAAAIVSRTPSALASPDWINLPWSANPDRRDILHYLLDLAVEIPGLLWQFDDIEAALKSGMYSPHEISVKQASLWSGVADLTDRFRQWKVQWVDNNPDGPPQEVEVSADDPFPRFHCRDFRTGGIITPPIFVYRDLRLAQTMCLYYSTRLILSSADTRPSDRVGPLEQYSLGCGICRSLEWYIVNAPGNMINRLAFPVRVAWEAFPDGGPERQFMYEVLKLVERRHALGLWGSNMSEISPRAGPPRSQSPELATGA
ncbi:C6 finger domain-containing protein [Aspergillus costaricaensis CBS 115574]|uniref:C6 finger domain-containing protein n=1 Tax=Aspergillus costaricaensis CBS 115574 TaxID=1448317 RepID=A0ACD1IDX9_9EURO|nr:C6 finger domain-containing protein [Aspergillus costaricaensis CBS 115574]RAK88560.1 C6 finger domain-containing protein [Aspergillus costaricaensis CBS 115574]